LEFDTAGKRDCTMKEKPMEEKSMSEHLPNLCSHCKGTGRVGKRGRYGRRYTAVERAVLAEWAKQRAEGKQDD
jgi:hypothetical protein